MSLKAQLKFRNVAIVLGAVASVFAFVLADIPDVLQKWTALLAPKGQVVTTEGGYAPTASAASKSDQSPGRLTAESGRPLSELTPASAPPPQQLQPATPALPTLQVDVQESVLARGATEESACTLAIEQVSRASTKKCDNIALQNSGQSNALNLTETACSRCAYVANSWQCLAKATGQCLVSR